MTTNDLQLGIIQSLALKGSEAAKAFSAGKGQLYGVADAIKASKARPLSYEKTKNLAKGSGAFYDSAGESLRALGRHGFREFGSNPRGLLKNLADGIVNKSDLNKGFSATGKSPTDRHAIAKALTYLTGTLGGAGTGSKLYQKASQNEAKRLGAITGAGAVAGGGGLAVNDGLTKSASIKFEMDLAQALVSAGALTGVLGSKYQKVHNARKFLNSPVNNKPGQVLLNKNSITANKLRGTRPGFGYNKKLDEYAKKENLKSTIARLGLGTTVGAGTYAGVTN